MVAVRKDYAAPTGLGFGLGCDSTNMSRLRRRGNGVRGSSWRCVALAKRRKPGRNLVATFSRMPLRQNGLVVLSAIRNCQGFSSSLEFGMDVWGKYGLNSRRKGKL